MASELVTVATFMTPAEAHLARNLLEAEGVVAFIADEESVGMFWHLGNALQGVKLQVPLFQAELAVQILEHRMPAETDDSGLDPERPTSWDDDEDDEASEQISEKPLRTRGAGRPVRWSDGPDERIADRDLAMEVSAESAGADADDDEPEAEGERLATRAFRAAVLGFFFVPLSIYSCWLVLQLLSWQGELSKGGSGKLHIALVLNCLVLVAYLGLCLYL